MAGYAAVFVVFLASGALAGPARYQFENQCAVSCSSYTVFDYEQGQTYEYEYKADVETTVAGATQEASRLHMTATVEVTANAACDFTMQLRSVTLKDSDPKNAASRQPVENMVTFQQELERFPISFNYETGQVKSLCANAADPAWVVNVKRGVLSLFNSVYSIKDQRASSRYEEDITGSCTAKYQLEDVGNSLLISKTKDLVTCSDRGHLSSALQGTYYKADSSVQSLPLLKGTLACSQKVVEGRIVSVTCEETHLFRPFSQGESGAMAYSSVQLTETGVRAARPSRSDSPTVSSSMKFDFSEIHDQQWATRDLMSQAEHLLQEMATNTADDIRPQVPRLFSRLVHTVRHLDSGDLMRLNSQVTSDPSRRYFIDALPLVNSAPALALMSQLIQNGDVTEKVSDKWMTSLAFVHEPTKEMVEAVARLATAPAPRRQTLLGVSSLVHHYCEKHDGCSSDHAVQTIASGMERLLVAGCMTRSEDEELHMLAVLKAMGNAGLLVGDGRALRSCYQNDNTMDVRLAAIRAYRRMSCSAIAESGLIKTFANEREDTEVRIAAYLAVMQCPTREVADIVQEVLSTKEVNQVTSFVWSHISSIQKTSDPTKRSLKSLLYDFNLAKKFNSDARKFSRYFEKTFYSTDMNAGATVDSQVIFSPDSFIPKSGMLNFTVDLFGQAINLLEIGGRVEGLEDFSESLFGDKGIFPVDALNNMMKTWQAKSNDVGTYASSGRIPTPQASTYLKIFGNELKFNKYNSLRELMSALNCNGPLDFLQRLAKDMDWTENYQFLDSSYTLPTIAGFPFMLKAEGTAALSLKTGGKFDIQSWTAMTIDGHIKPSAAISIRSEMRIDAFVAHAGLKVDSNLHTSTVFDGHAVVDSGKVVSVRINMPRDKVEILDVTTRFHSVHRNRMRSLNMDNAGEKFEMKACSDKYIPTKLLGINLCTDVMYTQTTERTPGFILAGPITARFVIEKTDTLKAFEFEYRHSDKSGMRKSSLVIDTPGSSIDRHISMAYSIDFEQKAFKAGFQTPIRSAELSGSLNLEGSKKKATGSLKVDDIEMFGFDTQLGVEATSVSVSYSPVLTLRGPPGDIVTLEGGLIVNKNKHKYDMHLTVSKLFAKPIVFSGHLNENEGTYTLESSMKSSLLDSNTKGVFRFAGKNLLVQANTDYSFMDGERQTVYLNGKMGGERRDGTDFYKIFMDSKFSALPALDTKFTLDYVSKRAHAEFGLSLERGERTYILTSLFNSDDHKLKGSVGFAAEHLDIDFKLGGAVGFAESNKVSVDLEAQLRKSLFAKSHVEVVYRRKGGTFNYGVSTSITLPGSMHSFEVGARREAQAGHLKLVAVREAYGDRKEIAFVALLELEDTQTGVELTLSVPGLPRMQASAAFVPGVGGMYVTHALIQYGAMKYSVGGRYKTEERAVDLTLETPSSNYEALAWITQLPDGWRFDSDLRFGRHVVIKAWTNEVQDGRTGNFEIFWNRDVSETQKATFEVMHRHNIVAAVLKYPGNEIKLDGTMLETGITADLHYTPGKVIHVEAGYEAPADTDIRVYAHARTPFENFRTISLDFIQTPSAVANTWEFELAGTLEDQEAKLKGIVAAEFRGGIVFKTDLELITPVTGWERNKFVVKYEHTENTLSASLMASRNDEVFSFGGEFELFNLPHVFKIHSGLELTLPFYPTRNGRIGFDLKLGEGNIDSGVLVSWRNQVNNEFSLDLNTQYDPSLLTASTTVTLRAPFYIGSVYYEKFVANLAYNWNTENWPAHTEFTLTTGDDELFHTGLRFNTWIHGEFVIRCAGCSGFNLTYGLDHLSITNRKMTVTAHFQGEEYSMVTTLNSDRSTPESVATDVTVTFRIPSNKFTIVQRQLVNINTMEGTQYLEIGWNDKKIVMDLGVKIKIEKSHGMLTKVTTTSYGKLLTPFAGWRSAHISRNQDATINGGKWDMTSNTQISKEDMLIETVDTFKMDDVSNWEMRQEITSNTEWVKDGIQTMRLSSSAGSAKFVMNSEMDGKTAELSYSQDLPVSSENTELDIKTSAKWYSGTAKTFHLNFVSDEEGYKPSLTLVYQGTMKLWGTISSVWTEGRSELTLEGLGGMSEQPLNLIVNHKFMGPEKQLMVKYLHAHGELYEIGFKLRPDFSSHAKLEVSFSSNDKHVGSFMAHLDYQLNHQLIVNGRITRNNWEMSLAGEMDMKKGQVSVGTPYQGFTEMQVSYSIPDSKNAELRLRRENRQILVTAEDQSTFNRMTYSYDRRAYSLRINTPYNGFETLSFVVNQERPNSFTLDYTRSRHASASFNTEYIISGPQSSLSVKAESNIPGFSSGELELSYDLISQNALAKFVLEGRAIEASFDADISALHSKANVEYRNTLVPGCEQITLSGQFDFRDVKKSIEAALVFDNGNKFSFDATAQLTRDESFLKLEAKSPVLFNKMEFNIGYERSWRGLRAKLKLSKDESEIKVFLDTEMNGSVGTVTLVATKTPYSTNHRVMFYGELNVENSPTVVKLAMENDNNKYEITANVKIHHDGSYVSIDTPFAGLEHLKAEVGDSRVGNKRTITLVLTRNTDKIEASLEKELSWSNSLVALKISTPFVQSSRLQFTMRYDLLSEQKTFFTYLAHNDKHVQMNVFMVLHAASATTFIEMETPIHNWENIKATAAYDLSKEEKMLEISYERNGVKKVLASRGSFNSEKAYLDIITPLEGYERMGISGQYVSRRGKREAGYEAHVNDHRHRLYVLYERQGMESAKLKIESPIHDIHLIEVDVRAQEFDDGVGYYINTNRDGKRNSAEIRTVRDGNSVGVDVSVRSYLPGLENLQMSGNVVYRGRKRSFSFKSSRGSVKTSISGQVIFKKKAGNGKLKASLPMIPGFEDADITFNYKLGPTKTFSMTSVRNGETRKFSGDLRYSGTSFEVNLNTPYNGFKKLHADASRTEGRDGRISATLNAQRGSRKIGITYDYLFEKAQGSGSVEVTTPYEGFYNMKSSLDYNIGDTERGVTFKASRDARAWSITTQRSWSGGVDTANLEITSPLDELKILKISRTFNFANLANMKYDATYERNDVKLSLSGTGSIVQKGKKVAFDVTLLTPFEIKKWRATVRYDFRRPTGTIYAKFQFGKRYAKLDATVSKTSGTMTLETTNPNLPKLDGSYNVNITPEKRDIQITLTRHDGRQLSVTYESDFSKPREANGELNVISTTFGARKLTWSYAIPGDNLDAAVAYSSPNGGLSGDLSVKGEAMKRRKIVLNTSIDFPGIYTSTQSTTINYNVKNGAMLRVKINYNGKTYHGFFNAKAKNGKRIVKITYDGQLLKDIEIDGTWDIPREVGGKKDFLITYKRGSKSAKLSGFVDLAASGKSGSFELNGESTLEELKNLDISMNWNMVLPNRILGFNYNRNGKRFSFDFTGSRYEKHADYSLKVSTPPLEIMPGNFVSETEASVSFDMRNGISFKASLAKPVEETFEFDLKFGRSQRTLKVNYHFVNNNGLVSYMPHQVDIQFSSKRTERSQGPKVEMDLKTSFQGFELITATIDANIEGPTKTITVDYRRGNRIGKLVGTLDSGANGRSISFNLKTPIEGLEQITASGSYEIDDDKLWKLNLDYKRGQKFLKLTSSVKLDRRVAGASIDVDLKWDSYITRSVDLLVTIDGSVTTEPRRSGKADIKVVLDGEAFSLSYSVSRAEANRRVAKLIVQTPFKYPYKKMVYTADVSTSSNKAGFGFEYGRKKIGLDVSWFAGEASQYGVEVRLETPFKGVRSVELDVKGTVRGQRGEKSIDVVVHYRRGDRMVHVTGNILPYAADLDVSTPWGNANVKAGIRKTDNYATEVLAMIESEAFTAGAIVTLKIGNPKDMEVGIDIRTPLENWQRFNVEAAYTNVKDSNIVKIAFESPVTKRIELAFEITNHTDNTKTDFRAGVTTNYLGKAFTFKTNILRDDAGMKYELEIESPFHILPSFKLTGRR